jgi:C-terminal processing protease CtpA/Prc
MRGNIGGYTSDIPLIISPLLASDLHYEYVRLKKSPGRLDYMSWVPDILKANPADSEYRALNAGTLPIVTLINDYSISCGEALPIAVKAMSTGHLIGTRTWGATGSRWGAESPSLTHGGCFTHNKLWTQVIQAGKQIRGLHFENYEGVGVPPDELVEFNLSDFNSGTDVQLEAAVAYIKRVNN